MIFEGLEVIHSIFGRGTVTQKDGKYITVKFESVTKKFVYPDAFEKHLTLSDGSVSSEIIADIVASKAEKQQIIDKKHQENVHSMTHGIVIPGKEVVNDPDEDEGSYKHNDTD